jgi:hypothetical protein
MVTQTQHVSVLVDPTTQPLAVPFRPAPRLADLCNKRVAIIDDSKENAKELLQEIVDLLRQHYGVADVRYHRKPSASKPADPEVIRELAQACDYAVVAIGS